MGRWPHRSLAEMTLSTPRSVAHFVHDVESIDPYDTHCTSRSDLEGTDSCGMNRSPISKKRSTLIRNAYAVSLHQTPRNRTLSMGSMYAIR